MNKQGNVYTIIYIIVLVVVVGTALAFTSISLRDRQQANADADKMRQILASVLINPEPSEVIGTYRGIVKETLLVNDRGECVGDDAFGVNVAEQSKLPAGERLLPVYVCTLADGAVKYVLPVYGAGLWGPIWGYVAFDDNGDTIYGAYFAHQGETPGLGAEIEKPAFSSQFDGKNIFSPDGVFESVAVVKKGQEPAGRPYVHAISGGTITSQGVQKMLSSSLEPYTNFFKSLNADNKDK